MGFLERLFGKPSPQPSKSSGPLTDDDLPPEQRWLLGAPPDYAWWLNDMLIAISDSRQPLLKALCAPDHLAASAGGKEISEVTKQRILSALDGFCSALTIDERKVPSRQELWPEYSHHTFVQTLGELKGLCELLSSYIRDGDVPRAWKLERRLHDERHWQLTDLQSLLGRFIVNRQDPTRREEALRTDVFLSQVELADLYEKPGYIDYMAERGYKPRWMTSKIANRNAAGEPADPAQLAAQLKALLIVLLRGLGAFYDVLNPSDRETLLRFLPALKGHGNLGTEEQSALKKAANEFGWVEYAIESATPEPAPLWPAFSRQAYRCLTQEMGGLASDITAGFVIGDLKRVSDALKKLVLAPGYRDQLWDFQCLLTRYDLAKKRPPERATAMQEEWTRRMVEHANYLVKLNSDPPGRDSRSMQEWHVNMTKALAREGTDIFYKGEYQSASELLDLALMCDPENVLAAFYMAASLSRMGEFDRAITFYEQAEVAGNTIGQYWSDRGLCLRALKRHDEALTCLERAVELSPDNGHWWTNKALVLEELGNYEAAISDCNRALAMDPNDTMALLCKGNSLDYLGRCREAVQSYDQALRLSPQSSQLWFNKAIALRRQGMYAEALQSCERAIEISPESEAAKALREQCLEAVGGGPGQQTER